MRNLGIYTPARTEFYRRGDSVVVRNDRGSEIGEVLCEATDALVDTMKDPGRGQLLRLAGEEDHAQIAWQLSQAPGDFAACKKHIGELGLEMKLIDVERILGGERLVVYYLAEQRVDFRELVKRLAEAFHTRVEMRQIGIRDEAKLLADYGDCGKPVCCNTHLSEMPPVSMKMAKLQKSTLDPNKISGRCGRLKCCLRYEYDTYVDLQRDLPPLGAEVISKRGRARVIGQEVLASQLLVELEDRRRVLLDLDEVLQVLPGKRRPMHYDDEHDPLHDHPHHQSHDDAADNGNSSFGGDLFNDEHGPLG